MCGFACPSAFETVTTSTPAASRLLANERRRWWNPRLAQLALRSAECSPARRRPVLLIGRTLAGIRS
jgi:hypothetical protein